MILITFNQLTVEHRKFMAAQKKRKLLITYFNISSNLQINKLLVSF